MPRIALALLLLLAACAAAPPQATWFRDPRVPMFSIAAFDPARLPGRWTQVAAFAAPGAPACEAGGGVIGDDLAVALDLCLNGGRVPVRGRLGAAGPGRLAVDGAVWWVVWVDEGYRTLAIGTPSGAFGFVLNRGGPLPDDRFRAAAEIFDFNGYDTRRLIRLP